MGNLPWGTIELPTNPRFLPFDPRIRPFAATCWLMAPVTLKLYQVKDLLAVLSLDGTVFQARGRSLLFVPTIERAASKAWVTVARIFESWRVEVYA